MKPFLRNVGITIILISLICVVFYRIGWITNWREVAILYFITFVVIFDNKLIDILSAKIHTWRGEVATEEFSIEG